MSRTGQQQAAQQALSLAPGAVFSATFTSSRLLSVRTGHVWITQQGRSEDFWLHAGDAILLQQGQLVVVEAAIASEIVVEQAAGSGLLSWCQTRLQAWLGNAAGGLKKRRLS